MKKHCPKCHNPVALHVEYYHCYFCGHHEARPTEVRVDKKIDGIYQTYLANKRLMYEMDIRLRQVMTKRFKKGTVLFVNGKRYCIIGHKIHPPAVIIAQLREKKQYAIPVDIMLNKEFRKEGNLPTIEEYRYTKRVVL